VAHISAYLGNKIGENFGTDEYFISEDGLNFPRNSQYAIVALKASVTDLKNLVLKLQTEEIAAKNMLWIAYVQEMIDMIDDNELATAFQKKAANGMDLLGIGIFGTKEDLKILTGKLSLWK
jgi:hypothetical protein